MSTKMFNLVLCAVVCAGIVTSSAVPKKYDSGFQQSWQGSSSNPGDRSTQAVHLQPPPTPSPETSRIDTPESTEANQPQKSQRLGFTGFGTTGVQGYPGTAAGIYTPLKLDLGGLLVGTLVSIGAIFILPKIVNIVSGGYGYARSEEGAESSGVTAVLSKLDDALSKYNIDSSSCMQRAVCSYVKTSEGNVAKGKADQFDQIVHAISGNSLVDYALEGTAIKEAISAGKKQMKDKTCEELYPGCPLDKQKGIQMLSNLLQA